MGPVSHVARRPRRAQGCGRHLKQISGVPSITGRVEINLTVPDPVRSAAWYAELLGMQQRYDFAGADGRMRYICLVEPRIGLVLCLVGHATNPGEPFSELHTG